MISPETPIHTHVVRPDRAPDLQPILFGRQKCFAQLNSILNDTGCQVSYVHGAAGSGKSALMNHFLGQAQEQGANCLTMDCRLVEPTTRGFLAELGNLANTPVTYLSDAAAAVAGTDTRVVLALDHYESFLLMDTWLRQNFLPAMPPHFRLIVASRQKPVPLWLTTTAWKDQFQDIALGPLENQPARQLLSAAGVADTDCADIVQATGGNPLALELAASAYRTHGSLSFSSPAFQEVMQELAQVALADIPHSETRDAVLYGSVARRITRSVLRSLDHADEDQYNQLRQLSFVESWRDGLRLQEGIRSALATSLHASDPERYFQCRRKIWSQLRQEVELAPRSDLWRYTADMLFLIENPVVREAFFPSGSQEFALESASANDWEEIREIGAIHEGPEGQACLQAWWENLPRAFRVARDRQGQVAAFYCMCQPDELNPPLLTADPVAQQWLDHLTSQPVADTARTLLLRRWLTKNEGEAPSCGQAACWLDVKRAYMELRPALRRVYLMINDLAIYAPVATQLGFQHLADLTLDMDGRQAHSALLDFGPDSVDGWITRLVGEELGIQSQSLIDNQRKALFLDGQFVDLTPLEFKLARFLESRPAVTASRDQILDHVWGYSDGSGSSNVVDAVVKTLRRKLGPQAGKLETVRGFGYRWKDS